MKVKLIGKGNSWTKDVLCTSYLINNDILLDIPEGSFKTIMNEIDINELSAVIISHMHSDHWLDFHLLACKIIYNRNNVEKIKLYVPSNFEERLKKLCEIIETPQVYFDLMKRVELINIKESKNIKLKDLNINSFEMRHSDLECYGFTFSDNHCTIGFTCDTGICESVDKIINQSNLIFIDCSNIKQRGNNHLSIEVLDQYKVKFPNKKFIPIHQSDEVVEYLKIKNKDVMENSIYELN